MQSFIGLKFHIALSLSIYSFSTLIVNYTRRTNTQVSFRNFALLAKYACWFLLRWLVSCGFLTQASIGVNSRQRHNHVFHIFLLLCSANDCLLTFLVISYHSVLLHSKCVYHWSGMHLFCGLALFSLIYLKQLSSSFVTVYMYLCTCILKKLVSEFTD